jgi:hypothetical protein
LKESKKDGFSDELIRICFFLTAAAAGPYREGDEEEGETLEFLIDCINQSNAVSRVKHNCSIKYKCNVYR